MAAAMPPSQRQSAANAPLSLPRHQQAPATALKERLALQDRERLLEPGDLRLPAPLPLLVRLWLRDAAVLDLLIVLKDGAELRRRRVFVGRELSDLLVQRR